jgi:four helix bundle protein
LDRKMQTEEKNLRHRTKHFALSIIRIFSIIPKTAEAQVLGKQVVRSGTSVGANYREAYRGRSKAEFIAKCGDSLRELEERSVPGGRDIDGQTRAGSE